MYLVRCDFVVTCVRHFQLSTLLLAFTVSHSITQFELRLACSLPLQKEKDNRMSIFSSLRSANVLAVAVTLSVTMHGQNVKAVKREIVDI